MKYKAHDLIPNMADTRHVWDIGYVPIPHVANLPFEGYDTWLIPNVAETV